MKRISLLSLVFAFLMLSQTVAFGQNKSWDNKAKIFKDGDRVGFCIDYSECSFKGFTEPEIYDEYGAEQWDKRKAELRNDVLSIIEEKLGRRSLLLFKETASNLNYIVKFKVQKIDKNGNLKGVVYIFKKLDDKEPVTAFNVSGDGGRIGSYMNLMKDGHKDAAEKIGKEIRKRIQK